MFKLALCLLLFEVGIQNSWSASLIPTPDCVTPTLGENIDWSTMPSPWFLTQSAQETFDEASVCFVIREFGEMTDGFQASAENYRLSQGSLVQSVMTLHQIRRKSGGYIMDPRAEAQWKGEMAENLELRKKFDAEFARTGRNEEFIFTDHENYIIATMCSSSGTKILSIQHRTPHPTNATLEITRQKLAELGNGWDKLKIHPTGCNTIEEYDGFKAFADNFQTDL